MMELPPSRKAIWDVQGANTLFLYIIESNLHQIFQNEFSEVMFSLLTCSVAPQ